MPAKGTEMRVQRARLWLTALVVGVTMTVLISGVGVPERLVQRAAASVPTPDPEPSVKGRAVPRPKAGKELPDLADLLLASHEARDLRGQLTRSRPPDHASPPRSP